MSNFHYHQLRGSLKQIDKFPGQTSLSRDLFGKSSVILEELLTNVLTEVSAYTETRKPEIQPELEQHLQDLLVELCRLLDQRNVQKLVFVSDHARLRAKQYFPLEAVLQTYRCCLKFITKHVRLSCDSANLTDLFLDYFDIASTLFAESYLQQISLGSNESADQKVALLSILLDGYDEADGRITNILQNSGYLDKHLSYCVALAQSVDSSEMFNTARARRLLETIDDILKSAPSNHLIDIYQNKVVIVFSHRRRSSGWSTPHSTLAVRLKSELRTVGNAALIGVSNDIPYLSLIPRAYKEARLALDIATVSRRVVQISEIAVQQLLIHLAADELQYVLPEWYGEFIQADARLHGALIRTLQAYADTNMNALKAAMVLDVHPNTIYARMRKIKDITGMDIKSYKDLTELFIIAQYYYKTVSGELKEH